MSVRRYLKSLAFSAMANPLRASSKLRQMSRQGDVAVLNFHRVGPQDGSTYHPLATDLFDDIIGFCSKAGNVVSFNELNGVRQTDRPTFVISFDDGYADFVEHALPVLRKHGVRCNHNFIPACAEDGLPPLNVRLQDFIGKAPASLLSDLVAELPYPVPPGQSRDTLGLRASAFLKAKPIAEQRRIFASLLPIIDKAGPTATAMMTLSDIRAVANEVEIGAHSYHHATLSAENDDYAADDARSCKRWFKGNLGINPNVYAVPNGAARESQVTTLVSEGFSTVLLVGERFSTSAQRIHSRFTIYGDSRAEVRSRSLGLRSA